MTALAAASRFESLARATTSASIWPGDLGGAEDHRAATQDACRHRALQRFRRCGIGHAAGLHAGHQSVFGDGHQRGIEHAALRRARQLARTAGTTGIR